MFGLYRHVFSFIKETERGTIMISRNKWIRKHTKKENNQHQVQNQHVSLSLNLSQNIDSLRSIYENCSDVVYRSFYIGGKTKAYLIYMEGLCNTEEIDASVLSPL